MIDFNQIRLDLSGLPDLTLKCYLHTAENPACQVHSHWRRAELEDAAALRRGSFASLNWVGHGYPASFARGIDWTDVLGLQSKFAQPGTLDVQSAVHQFYSIVTLAPVVKDYWVVDIGCGYGRLALAFFAAFGAKVHYRSVEFVPLSMCAAPQVVKTFFPEADFKVVPAWEIYTLQDQAFDIGISTHSMQEMSRQTVAFYLAQLRRALRPTGIFYTVNQQPDFDEGVGYHPSTQYHFSEYFQRVYSQPYPFNLGPLEMLEEVYQRRLP